MNITQSTSWQKLELHYQQIKDIHMREMFAEDSERHEKMSLHIEDILLDYSKNRLNQTTLDLLFALAREAGIEKHRDEMFTGYPINNTENRAVLHTALRSSSDKSIFVEGENVIPKVHQVLEKVHLFSDKVREGSWTGWSGKPITDIVNIGIGGSDLGPKMVCQALNYSHHPRLNAHFISNIDGVAFLQTVKKLNPKTTLFIVVSKTFTTQETMTNAQSARKWFLQTAKNEKHIAKHFVAVSTNAKLVQDFGIDKNNMFEFWDFVGGRYSLWSAVSLIVAIMSGMDKFKEFLAGGNMMDKHFLNAPLESNMPVILALIGIWYNNFFNCESYAVLPYDEQLSHFPAFFEQLDMESNGKSVTRSGKKINYYTGPIVWGDQGINAQHAFYQSIHQGTKLIPADFITSVLPNEKIGNHHDIMMSNFFAQTEALYKGRNTVETCASLRNSEASEAQIKALLPHMIFKGNNPSNSLIFRKLKPRSLGALIALYEHKVFLQGVIWDINSFDQWGVELGKQLAKTILTELNDDDTVTSHDSSTNNLINYYKLIRQT